MARDLSVAGTATCEHVVGLRSVLGATESDTLAEQLERALLRTVFMLHDGPVQSLCAAGAMLARAAKREDEQSTQSCIAAAEGLIEHATFELRAIMTDLSPVELDGDELSEMIVDYVADSRPICEFEISLSTARTSREVPQVVRVAVLRIVQEALANVREHAAARHAVVTLDVGDELSCSVADDGIGFDQDASQCSDHGQHWGLKSMRDRAELVGGQLSIRSAPGQGTRVTVSVPLDGRWS